jgi:hypothetical protein
MRRAIVPALLLLAPLLLIVACNGGGDDDTDGGDSETPEATPTPRATATPTARPTPSPTPTPTPDRGSASLTFSGEVSGGFTLAGMTCDFLGGATDNVLASISGALSGGSYTVDINTPQFGALGLVALTGGDEFGEWDNLTPGGANEPRADSGSVTVSEGGGQLSVELAPAADDAGSATAKVMIEGSWTCPGGVYQQ